jgi:hypothetical protein
MASEAKASTVIPTRTIKSAFNFTPVSACYNERTNTTGDNENVFPANDVSVSFNTYASDSVANVRISPGLLKFGGIFIVELSILCPANFETSPPTNYHPSDYVAYKAFEYISYRVPGAERRILSGDWLAHMQLVQCENQEKRFRLLELAGRQSTGKNSTTQKIYGLMAYPWSSVYAGDDLKPKDFPYHLTNEPMDLEFKIRPYADFLGTGSTLNGARLLYIYSHLGSLTEYKAVIHKYPFKDHFHFRYPSPVAAANGMRAVVATGLRGGECTQMTLRVVPNDLLKASLMKGLKMKDIRVSFQGTSIWVAEGGVQEMYELCQNRTGNFISDSYAGLDAVAPTSTDTRSYFYIIPFARKVDHMVGQHYCIGPDFNNAEVKIEYSLEVASTTLADVATPATSHVLLIDQSVTSQYQLNGQSGVIIQ